MLTDLAVASMFKGDTTIPRFFMTGDGHRSPPFAWTMACDTLKLHFQNLMLTDQLCAHVEQQQSDVRPGSVPGPLQLLYQQQRIFGWELDIYKDLLKVMELCLDVASRVSYEAPPKVLNDVVAVDKEIIRVHALLWKIGNPIALRNAAAQSLNYRQYYENVCKAKAPRNLGTERLYSQFLMGYQNIAMGLRTTVNNYIGANIQRVINQFPNCTHLITCGDAHITYNPLAQYILLPQGAVGIVDASAM